MNGDKERPGPSHPRYRDEWPDVEREISLPPVDYERWPRIVREPSPKAPNRIDRLIDLAIQHQVVLALVLWLAAVGLLTWWLA